MTIWHLIGVVIWFVGAFCICAAATFAALAIWFELEVRRQNRYLAALSKAWKESR